MTPTTTASLRLLGVVVALGLTAYSGSRLSETRDELGTTHKGLDEAQARQKTAESALATAAGAFAAATQTIAARDATLKAKDAELAAATKRLGELAAVNSTNADALTAARKAQELVLSELAAVNSMSAEKLAKEREARERTARALALARNEALLLERELERPDDLRPTFGAHEELELALGPLMPGTARGLPPPRPGGDEPTGELFGVELEADTQVAAFVRGGLLTNRVVIPPRGTVFRWNREARTSLDTARTWRVWVKTGQASVQFRVKLDVAAGIDQHVVQEGSVSFNLPKLETEPKPIVLKAKFKTRAGGPDVEATIEGSARLTRVGPTKELLCCVLSASELKGPLTVRLDKLVCREGRKTLATWTPGRAAPRSGPEARLDVSSSQAELLLPRLTVPPTVDGLELTLAVGDQPAITLSCARAGDTFKGKWAEGSLGLSLRVHLENPPPTPPSLPPGVPSHTCFLELHGAGRVKNLSVTSHNAVVRGRTRVMEAQPEGRLFPSCATITVEEDTWLAVEIKRESGPVARCFVPVWWNGRALPETQLFIPDALGPLRLTVKVAETRAVLDFLGDEIAKQAKAPLDDDHRRRLAAQEALCKRKLTRVLEEELDAIDGALSVFDAAPRIFGEQGPNPRKAQSGVDGVKQFLLYYGDYVRKATPEIRRVLLPNNEGSQPGPAQRGGAARTYDLGLKPLHLLWRVGTRGPIPYFSELFHGSRSSVKPLEIWPINENHPAIDKYRPLLTAFFVLPQNDELQFKVQVEPRPARQSDVVVYAIDHNGSRYEWPLDP